MQDEEALHEVVKALRTDALTPAQKDALRAGLGPLLGSAPGGGGSGPGPASAGASWKVWVGAAGVGTMLLVGGIAGWRALEPAPAPIAEPTRSEAPIPTAAQREEPLGVAPEAPREVEAAAPTRPAPARRTPGRGTPGLRTPGLRTPVPLSTPREVAAPTEVRAPRETRPAPASPDPVDEHTLLVRARRALPGSPEEALSLADAHRSRFPGGVLAQEREVIAIEALDRLGRRSAARARATRLRSRWPDSPYVRRLNEMGFSGE